MVISYLNT